MIISICIGEERSGSRSFRKGEVLERAGKKDRREEHVTTGSDMPEREKIVRYSPNGVKMDHASERENAGMEFE